MVKNMSVVEREGFCQLLFVCFAQHAMLPQFFYIKLMKNNQFVID